MRQIKIKKVWVDSDHVYAQTEQGDCASYAFADWPRLANATPEQRANFQLSFFGIHWPQIDEDLSFEGMFLDSNYQRANEDQFVYGV